MSATKVSSVQLVVSEEFAGVLKALVFALNWDSFEGAEKFVDDLTEIDVGEADIYYNESSGEFERT